MEDNFIGGLQNEIRWELGGQEGRGGGGGGREREKTAKTYNTVRETCFLTFKTLFPFQFSLHFLLLPSFLPSVLSLFLIVVFVPGIRFNLPVSQLSHLR